MFALLKTLHLVALVFGSAAALGNLYLGFAMDKTDLAAPGFTNKVRKYYRFTSLLAISVLWLTGLLLMIGWHGVWVDGISFLIKIMFALVLTGIIVFMNVMSPAWARRGGPPGYVPLLHWIGGSLLIVIVIMAVLAFA